MMREIKDWPRADEITLHIVRIGGGRNEINRVVDVAYRLQKARSILDVLHDCDGERNKVVAAAEVMVKNVNDYRHKLEVIQKYIYMADCEKVKETVELMREVVYTALEKLALVLGEDKVANAMKYIEIAEDLMVSAVDVVFYHLQYTVG